MFFQGKFSVFALIVIFGAVLGYPNEGIDPFIGINNRVDTILADLRQALVSGDRGTIHLPTDSANFTAQLFNSTLAGYLWVGDGTVEGLESVHRTGDFTLQTEPLQGREVVTGTVGLTDLNGKISTQFHLGPFRSHFGATFKISFADLYIRAAYVLIPRGIELENCTLADLDTLQIHLHGIGIFDSRLYSMVIDTLTQILEPVITTKLSNFVCGLLEDAINGPFNAEVFMMK